MIRTKTRAYLILEYCDGGELVRRVTAQKAMSERQAATVIRQCLSALAFMHSHDIVHRDLKVFPPLAFFGGWVVQFSYRLV